LAADLPSRTQPEHSISLGVKVTDESAPTIPGQEQLWMRAQVVTGDAIATISDSGANIEQVARFIEALFTDNAPPMLLDLGDPHPGRVECFVSAAGRHDQFCPSVAGVGHSTQVAKRLKKQRPRRRPLRPPWQTVRRCRFG